MGGHLFQGRYKAIIVEAGRFLPELVGHVLRNPVAAGLVEEAHAWPWSSAGAVAKTAPAHDWLALETLFERMGQNARTARTELKRLLIADDARPSVWRELNRQIYLGSDRFVSEVQRLGGIDHEDRNIPRSQRRPVAQSLAEIAAEAPDRNSAIVAAYETGAYSYSQIGDYFGLCFTTVGRIVRQAREAARTAAQAAALATAPAKQRRVARREPASKSVPATKPAVPRQPSKPEPEPPQERQLSLI